MGRRCEEWSEEDGSEQLETKDAGEEAMERNNCASQNSQRVVELKEEEVWGRKKMCVWWEVLGPNFGLERLRATLDESYIPLYLVRDSAVSFIPVVCSSSEIIRCSYQYTVSGMIAQKR